MAPTGPADPETLRRDVTRTLAEAIARAAAATPTELESGRAAWERLLQDARRLIDPAAPAGQPAPSRPAMAIHRPSVVVVDPSSKDWKAPEYEIVDRSRDALQALAHVQELRPDAVLYALPAYTFQDASAIAELAQIGIALRVIVLTDDDQDRRRLAVVRRPRITVLPRDADRAALAAALGVDLLDDPADDAERIAPGADGLTVREAEVLHLMAAGKANKQIASDLGVSIATAKYHVANILRKLEATNRAQALVKAYEAGLLLR